ncbi:MAG: GGDEF domain-containing protein [Christensenellaceae bacterium]
MDFFKRLPIKKLDAKQKAVFKKHFIKSNERRMIIPIYVVFFIGIYNLSIATSVNFKEPYAGALALTWSIILTSVTYIVLSTLIIRHKITSLKLREALIYIYWGLLLVELLIYSAQEYRNSGTAYNYLVILIVIAAVPLLNFLQISILSVGGLVLFSVLDYTAPQFERVFPMLVSTVVISILISQMIYFSTRDSVVAHEQLQDRSERDGLTGLYNRMGIESKVPALWEKCMDEKKNIGVMMIDIDFFKKCNDTYGHLQADEFLKKISLLIQNNVEAKGGIAVRYGGEEILCIIPEMETIEFIEFSKRLKILVGDLPMHIDTGKTIYITVSIGIEIGVPSALEESEFTDMVKKADEALYKAKQDGRNRVAFRGKTIAA